MNPTLGLLGGAAALLIAAWVMHRREARGQTWALDLGTSNTALANWDEGQARPEVVALQDIGNSASGRDAALLSRGVPSALHILGSPGRAFGPWRTPRVLIGRRALGVNHLQTSPCFVPSFKRALAHAPLAPLATTAQHSFTARDAAELYLRELFAQARRSARTPVRELVVTTPVEAYETYRAELTLIGKRLGLRRIRFLDEPVAAALGYGLSLTHDRKVLVVDFGGGTLDLALVHLGARQAQAGKAEVLAKAGRELGGDTVDAWLAEALCQRLDWHPERSGDGLGDMRLRLLRAEARRAKEAVYFDGAALFEAPAGEARWGNAQHCSGEGAWELRREDLAQLLEDRGLYHALDACLTELLAQASARGVAETDIEDVLMVGGSTLLPGVYPVFEKRLGRERVRAWQPFEAVAWGAAVFAAGQVAPKDVIVHDYALETWDEGARTPTHAVIVPAGTRFPTAPDLWKQQLVPACRLGEPEDVFKLFVCELGTAGGGVGFTWDADGRVQKVEAGSKARTVVKLNEASPAMGKLRPPHQPGDRSPRLEVSFGINAERWLCSTVVDLQTRKTLLRDEPVVRLL